MQRSSSSFHPNSKRLLLSSVLVFVICWKYGKCTRAIFTFIIAGILQAIRLGCHSENDLGQKSNLPLSLTMEH